MVKLIVNANTIIYFNISNTIKLYCNRVPLCPNVRWKQSLVEEVNNRNYMYFQKGADFIRTELMKYNGRKIYVSDDIGRWQNGV